MNLSMRATATVPRSICSPCVQPVLRIHQVSQVVVRSANNASVSCSADSIRTTPDTESVNGIDAATTSEFVLPKWMKHAMLVLGSAVLALVMMFAAPSSAEAARSGGRVGGSNFASRGSSSSYSAPSGGRTSGSLGAAGGMGYRGPSTVIVSPSYGFGYPMFMPMGGMGYGGGSSFFTLMVLGIFAYVAFQTFTSMTGSNDEYDDEVAAVDEPMSVIKLQVGLLGSARQLKRDLDTMANSIDTSTPSGLHYLLQETVLTLRRNPQYACYGKATLIKTRGLDNAEAKFNQVSMEERGKFETETLSNYGGRKSSSVSRSSGDGLNELIVVTILAAVDGKLETQDILSVEDLKTDLNLLGSIPSSRLLALEVLWTPQDDNDFFTKDQLIEDYPSLNTI